MNDKLQIVSGLLGSLAIFIYGMSMMSECLQKAAGERMKQILSLLTRNPVAAALLGVLVTAVLQSSSAVTVMAIGFVSAGLMTLPQAISIIFGANIGTTVTAQVIAFRLSDYIYLIIFAGFALYHAGRRERIKQIGQTVFAFGLLFLGIETMGSVLKPLASSPVFADMIRQVADRPVLGVVAGTLMTLVVQSSSATIAVLQNLASQTGADGVSSVVGLAGAIPILLGDNIGTTITALIASVGQTRDAKRTALAHCVFNMSGMLLFIWFIHPFAALIRGISPKGPETEVIARQIANAHTVFNLVTALIWIPLIAVMVRIVMVLIPDAGQEKADTTGLLYLDENMISQPAAALQMAAREVLHCADITGRGLHLIAGEKWTENKEMLDGISKESRAVSKLYEKISGYLSELFASGGLTESQAAHGAGLLYVLEDIERLAYLSGEVADNLKEHAAKENRYSQEAMGDLRQSLSLLEEMFRETVRILRAGDRERAGILEEQRDRMLDLDIRMRKEHARRVKEGNCRADLTEPFAQILHSVGRMGNACVNIADAVTSGMHFEYFLEGDPGKG